MHEAVLHPLPRRADVVREQFLSVGLSLKREAMTVAGLAGLVTLAVTWAEATSTAATAVEFLPEAGIPVALLSLLVPLAVWKGEGPAQRGYHHAMPVQHGGHAIARALSGLVWLLAAVGAYFGWLAFLAAFTGGNIRPAPTHQWLAPFAGATVLYLIGSALALRVAHAWRWIGGAFVGYLFLGALQAGGMGLLYRLVNEALFGRMGLSTVVTGEGTHPWQYRYGYHHPSASVWLAATWLWLAIAVTLFVWAAYRQPES